MQDEGEKEMRERNGCVREKEEMVVESNERVDNEERVKRDPESEYRDRVFVILLVDSGAIVVSEMEREE